MIQFIFSHLWILIVIVLIVTMEYTGWHSAMQDYKKLGKLDGLYALICIHLTIIGFASFLYWVAFAFPVKLG